MTSEQSEPVRTLRVDEQEIRNYQVGSPLILLAFRDNHDLAVPVPSGKFIQVRPLPNDEVLVLVVVDGEEFHAFASDVRECCIPASSVRREMQLRTVA